MIDTVLAWPLLDEVLLSLATLGLAIGLHVYFQRRVLPPTPSPRTRRFRNRVVAGAIVLIAAVALLQIWRGEVQAFNEIHQWLRGSDDGQHQSSYGKLLWTLVMAMAVYLLVHVAQHRLLKGIDNIDIRHKLRRTISRVGAALFALLTFIIWTEGQELGVSLGIFGAGLALSLQEMLLCVAGWGLLMIQKPYDIGDRIEINGQVGDVIDIRVIQTSLLEVGNWVRADQSTGRIINVPNSALYRGTVSNYTKGFPFIWNELVIIVTFESDWERAKEIIVRQADEEADKLEEEVRRQITIMQGQYAIHYEHLRPIVYTSVVDNGVALTLRYLSPVRERRATAHRIWEGILREFGQENAIDFAYPSTRIFRNNEEGKPGAGGPSEPIRPVGRYYEGPVGDPETLS